MNICFGSRVTSSDLKELGILKELLIDPAAREIAYLVVQRGLFFPTDTLVPADAVAGVTDGGIRLNQTSEMISGQVQELSAPETQPARSIIPPGFVPGELPPPVAAPDDTVEIDHDTPVETAEGYTAGRVAAIRTADHRLTHLRLKGGILQAGREIPAECIAGIEDNRVVLTISREELEKLPA